MSATGTRMAAAAAGAQMTKGQRMAREMAEQLGGIPVQAGSGGFRLTSKAEAERRKLIDAARAKLEAGKALDAEQIADVVVQPKKQAKRIPTEMNLLQPVQEFVEINYQGSLKGTDFMWGVHKAGCKDAAKDAKQYGMTTSHTASSLRDLLDQIVDGESRGLGWGDENVKVHNCVKFPKPIGNPEATAAVLKAQPQPKATKVQAAPAVPAGQKFCKFHNTTHPADLEHFASNKAAADGLYYICKVAEKAQRDAKKQAAPQATGQSPVAAAATVTPASPKGGRAKK